MTDVWKSNARRFCQLCKVWFADNRISIEHHEGGQKHKAAIQAKLRELGKQNQEKKKAQSDLEATLAKMEAAANKSMGASETLPSAGIVGPMPKPKKYMDPKAHSSSVVELAHHMAQRKKEQEEERSQSVISKENKYNPMDETVWVEARTDNGTPYYFHMYSGVTVWEQPKNYYTAEQYAMKLATMESSSVAMLNSTAAKSDEWKSGTGQINLYGPNSMNEEESKVTPSEHRVVNSDSDKKTTNFSTGECDIPLPSPNPRESKGNQAVESNFAKEPPAIKVEPKEAPEEIQHNEPSRFSPYGAWVPVEKPLVKQEVNWELPNEEKGKDRTSGSVLAPEDVIVFADKTAAVKKRKVEGPIEFKKRKTVLKSRRPVDD